MFLYYSVSDRTGNLWHTAWKSLGDIAIIEITWKEINNFKYMKVLD